MRPFHFCFLFSLGPYEPAGKRMAEREGLLVASAPRPAGRCRASPSPVCSGVLRTASRSNPLYRVRTPVTSISLLRDFAPIKVRWRRGRDYSSLPLLALRVGVGLRPPPFAQRPSAASRSNPLFRVRTPVTSIRLFPGLRPDKSRMAEREGLLVASAPRPAGRCRASPSPVCSASFGRFAIEPSFPGSNPCHFNPSFPGTTSR